MARQPRRAPSRLDDLPPELPVLKDTDYWRSPFAVTCIADKMEPSEIIFDPFGYPGEEKDHPDWEFMLHEHDMGHGKPWDAYDEGLAWKPGFIFANGPMSGDYQQRTAARLVQEVTFTSYTEALFVSTCAPGSRWWTELVWPYCSGVAWIGRPAFITPFDIYAVDEETGVRTLKAKAGEPVNGNRQEMALVYYGPHYNRFARFAAQSGYETSKA